jgi:hypothetical protein
MLALLVALLAADPPPSVLRIQVSEPGAELSVRAAAAGWSGACPTPVTTGRPCEIAMAAERQLVDLHVSGTRAFDSTLLVGPAPTTVRIEHGGYAVAGAGVAMVLAGIVGIAAGVSTFEDGNESTGRTLVSVGASVEAVGILMILMDLQRNHDRAVVVE